MLALALVVSAPDARAGQNASAYADLSWDRDLLVTDRSLIPQESFPIFVRLHGIASARKIGIHLRWFPRTIGEQCYELVDGPASDPCGTLLNIPPGGSGPDTIYTGSIEFSAPPQAEVCLVGWIGHADCEGIQAGRFYVAHLMIEDAAGERDLVPIVNEVTVLAGQGIEQPLAVQSSGKTWLIPGFVNSFHVSGAGFDTTATAVLVGAPGSVSAQVAFDSPRSLTVSFDPPEDFVGAALLVVGNAAGAFDTLAASIAVFDSTAATGTGVNGTDAPMDKLGTDGVWRKMPGDSTWTFVPAIPDSVLAQEPDRVLDFIREYSTPRTGSLARKGPRERQVDRPPSAFDSRPVRPARAQVEYDRTQLFLADFEDYGTWHYAWDRIPSVDGNPTWDRVVQPCAKSFSGQASLSPVGENVSHAPYCFGYFGVPAIPAGTDIYQKYATSIGSYRSAEISFLRWIDTYVSQTAWDALYWLYSTDDGANWIVGTGANGLAGENRYWQRESINLDTQGGFVGSVKLKLKFLPMTGPGFNWAPSDSGVFVDDVSIVGNPYPNLTYWRPDEPGNSWSSPVIVASHPNATADEPVSMGGTTYVRFGIRNNSYSATNSSFRVTLSAEDLGTLFDQRLGPFSPWQKWTSPNIQVSIPSDFCGVKNLQLNVDADSEVLEQDETTSDDYYSRTAAWQAPSRPDLRIVSAWASPASTCAGQPVTLTVVVQNLGTATAGSAQVVVAPQGTSLCSAGAIGSTSSLGPFALDTLSTTVSAASPTTRGYNFAVDCPDLIDEGCPDYEGNNSFGPVPVTWTAKLGDLAVTSLSASSPTATVGATEQVSVTIANLGQVSTPSLWVFDWYRDLAQAPAPSQAGGDRYIVKAALAPGADTTIVLSKTSNTTGVWRMYVRVNANNAISECLADAANNVAGPVVLTWVSESLLVRGRFTYRDTGYVRDGAPIGADAFAVHPVRGARVAIMDKDGSVNELLGTTCTDDSGRFAYSLPSRYDTEPGPIEQPRHLIDVFARVLLNADEVCAGIPAVNVKHWSDSTTWYFDTPVEMNVQADLLDFGEVSPPLGPGSYGIRSAMHIYETVLSAAQRMRGFGFEPVTYPVERRWNAFVRWEPGGESLAPKYNLSLSLADTVYLVGARYLRGNPFTPDEWDDYVLLHEYGHLIARKGGFSYTLPPGTPADSCGLHGVAQPIMCPPRTPSHGLGWEEGWCMFVGALLDSSGSDPVIGDRGYGPSDSLWSRMHDLEDGNGSYGEVGNPLSFTYPSVNDSGPAFQEANAGALWDWVDAMDDDQNQDGCDDHLSEEFSRVVATLIADPGLPVDSLVNLYMAYQHRYLAGDPSRARALFEVLCEHGFWNAGTDSDTTGYAGVDPSLGGPPRFSASPSPSNGPVVFRVHATSLGDAQAPIVQIFDVAGRAIWRATTRPLSAGLWEATWAGPGATRASARPGIYFARCIVGDLSLRRTLVVRR